MLRAHCMFTCLLPLVTNTKSLQNLSITWERNVLFFFFVFISSISHSPASQFHIGRIFARHWSSRTRPSPPRSTAHRSASRRPLPPCEKSGRLLLSHQLPFYPDTGWKGLFLFKKNQTVSIKSSETPELHLLQPLINRGSNICDFRLDFKAGATVVTAPIQHHFHVVSVCVMTLLGQRGDTNSTLQKKGAFHQMRRASLPLQTGCEATGLMMELTS